MTLTHHRKSIVVSTRGRGGYEITEEARITVAESRVAEGLCQVFVHHTSASLVVNENADPQVRRDFDAFLDRLVPDGDPLFAHVAEGEDDMPAHVRSALTATSVGIPVSEGSLDLGTWQGLFLWEHRCAPHRRRLTVTVIGHGRKPT